jgi:transcriptional regulator with XRE-family HTH domain
MVMLASKDRPTMGRRARPPDESTYQGRFAARLKILRVKSGMDHEQAAKAITRLGWPVTKNTIYKWEQGRAYPHYTALPFVAEAYGVDTVRNLLPKE